MKKTALCFDIGGSKYITGLIDEDGTVLKTQKDTWKELSKEGILASLFASGDAMLAQAAAEGLPKPSAVGSTIPGLTDAEKGIWVEASFSGIKNFRIAEALREHFGLPVAIDNDSRACTRAEMRFGCCRNVRDFFYMTVSNGIGGAVVIDGKPYTGALSNAGEIGHCRIVEENGRPCKCGGTGCMEIQAAGPGISRNYLELGGTPLPDGSAPSCLEITERARAGEQAAIETFRLEGRYLGTGLAWAANLLNPEKIVIGGGVSLAFDQYGPYLMKEFRERIYRNANPGLTVEPTPLGYLEALYGAAALAFGELEK